MQTWWWKKARNQSQVLIGNARDVQQHSATLRFSWIKHWTCQFNSFWLSWMTEDFNVLVTLNYTAYNFDDTTAGRYLRMLCILIIWSWNITLDSVVDDIPSTRRKSWEVLLAQSHIVFFVSDWSETQFVIQILLLISDARRKIGGRPHRPREQISRLVGQTLRNSRL